MKNRIILRTIVMTIGLFWSIEFVAQTIEPQPMPCSEVSDEELDTDMSVQDCLILEDVTISSGTQESEIEIKAGKEIQVLPETVLSPDVVPISLCIEAPGVDLSWFEPSTPGVVPLFEKMEIGIQLPLHIQGEIDQFIAHNEPLIFPMINPFNPEEIDVYAEIQFEVEPGVWSVVERINGFYFEDHVRDISDPEIQLWKWDKLNTEHSFRIRYAPRVLNQHRCKVLIVTPDEILESDYFEFEVENSDNPGYVKVGSSERYLALGNDQTFFPVGQDMVLAKILSVDNSIYTDTICDLIDSTSAFIKTYHGCTEDPPDSPVLIPYSFSVNDGHRWYPFSPLAYVENDEQMVELAASGANFFRIISYPTNFGLEYRNLNDYSDRMHAACEFDQLLNLSKELGLRINWSMQSQNEFQFAPFSQRNWDWYEEYDTLGVLQNPGNCYGSDDLIGINTPEEFFTSDLALHYYKRKIRYYIARWGYSTEIALIDLFCEIDGIGSDGGADGAYHNTTEVQESIAVWHQSMGSYIKDQLGHDYHLLAPQYTTGGPAEGDNSYDLDVLDVNCESHYRADAGRFVHLIENYNYADKGKPYLFNEIGPGTGNRCDPNNACDITEMLVSPFVGAAGMALSWDNQVRHDRSHWPLFGHVRQFMDGLDLAGMDWAPHGHIRPDKEASIVYLKSGSYQTDDIRIVGAVMNENFNMHAIRDCSYLDYDALGCPNGPMQGFGQNYLGLAENDSCTGTINSYDQCPCHGDLDSLFYDYENGIFDLSFFQPVIASEENSKKLGIPFNSVGEDSYVIRFYNPFEGSYYVDEFGEDEQIISVQNFPPDPNDPDPYIDLEIVFPELGYENPVVYFELYDADLPSLKSTFTNNSGLSLFQVESASGDANVDKDNVSSSLDLKLWPNPTTDQLKVALSSIRISGDLFIVDELGHTVFGVPIKSSGFTIDVSQLRSGVYFVKINSDRGRIVKRFTKL